MNPISSAVSFVPSRFFSIRSTARISVRGSRASEVSDDALYDVREALARAIGHREHFLMGHVVNEPGQACRHVGDGGDRQDAHALMARREHLWDGAHADRVRTPATKHAELRGRL